MTNTDELAVYPSLKDKSVLITGGASGIGEQLVRGFARQGSKVAFLDILEDAGERLASEVKASFHLCDLREVKQIKSAVAKVASTQGDLQVLVNNAANDERHPWEDVTTDYWDERIAINLRPYFFTTQAVASMMIRANGGSIINFGSGSWMLGQGNMPGYTASKAGIHALSRSFARDLGEHNIRVNTIVPGWTMTERQEKMWLTPESWRNNQNQVCLPGKLMPIEMANMALWLAAADSKMCTAQNFIVDCGWL